MGKLKEHGSSIPQGLTIRLGRFTITRTLPGKVWIEDTTCGEGGSFDEAAIEAAIAEMYAREF